MLLTIFDIPLKKFLFYDAVLDFVYNELHSEHDSLNMKMHHNLPAMQNLLRIFAL